MAAKRFLCIGLVAISCTAIAQAPDCPKRGVPLPTRPPQLGEVPENGVYDVQEGYVSAILNFRRSARPGALPPQSAAIAADVSSTPLARWSYEGYLPERVPYRVTRFFRSPEGALLALSEWDYAADVGAVTMQGLNNRIIHGRPAGLFAMRAPSGCVSTTLSWKDDRKLYRLELVGPLDAAAQRAALTQVGEALAQ
jgi:hypothetical protein